MKFAIFIVKLLSLGALFIISNHNLHLLVPAERNLFFEIFYTWVGSLFQQGADVTSYVVKFEWLPKESDSLNNLYSLIQAILNIYK